MSKLITIGYREDLLKSPPLTHALNHLRWMAALAVAAAHTRNLLFPDYSNITSSSIELKIFYFITLFGTQAVVVFFAISGLLVGGRIIRDYKSKRLNLPNFFIDRFSRLYIVLIPALILSITLSAIYNKNSCTYSLSSVIGNLLFLQNILTEPICNNHPLWSLSNEAFYYIFTATIAWHASSKKTITTLIFASFFLLILYTILPDKSVTSIVVAMPFWLVGVIPWFVKINLKFQLFGTLFLAALILSRLHIIEYKFLDNLLISTTLILTLCSNWSKSYFTGDWAAKFSYSLYLVHMPVAVFFGNILDQLDPKRPASFIIYGLVMIIIYLIAWLFGKIFESRTLSLKLWANKIWQKSI